MVALSSFRMECSIPLSPGFASYPGKTRSAHLDLSTSHIDEESIVIAWNPLPQNSCHHRNSRSIPVVFLQITLLRFRRKEKNNFVGLVSSFWILWARHFGWSVRVYWIPDSRSTHPRLDLTCSSPGSENLFRISSLLQWT